MADDSDLPSLANQAADKYRIPRSWFRSLIGKGEGGFRNPTGVSPKGAEGVGQLMPETARDMGVTDRQDPAQNLDGSARYAAQLFRKYKGDTRLASAAYNAGPGAVDKAGGVPHISETQAYVKRVDPPDASEFLDAKPPPSAEDFLSVKPPAGSAQSYADEAAADAADSRMHAVKAQEEAERAGAPKRPTPLQRAGEQFASGMAEGFTGGLQGTRDVAAPSPIGALNTVANLTDPLAHLISAAAGGPETSIQMPQLSDSPFGGSNWLAQIDPLLAKAPKSFAGGLTRFVGGLVGGAALGGPEDAGVAAERRALANLPNTLAAVTRGGGAEAAHLADVKLLHDEGFSISPGMIKGGPEIDAEAKMISDPNRGPAIREKVEQTKDDFNRWMYNQTLKLAGMSYPKEGPVGPKGIAAVHDAISAGYRAIIPKMRVVKDAGITDAITAGRNDLKGNTGPERAEFNDFIKTRVLPSFDKAGHMDGATFKGLEEELTGDISRLSNGGHFQRQQAAALRKVLTALRASSEANSAPEIRGQLKGLNAAYASYKDVEDASLAAMGQGGRFTPLQLKRALAKGGETNRSLTAQSKGRFSEVIDAADRMFSKYPDSGTAGRTLANQARMGTEAGAAAGAAAGGLVGHAPGAFVGAGVGSVLGRMGERALRPTANALARSALERESLKQLQRRGIAQPPNYLKALEQRARARRLGSTAALGAGSTVPQP